jgi:quinohemoprotein ethanol dehydrogenase
MRTQFLRRLSVALAGILAAASFGIAELTIASDAQLTDTGANWPAYGRTDSEQRFSPLVEINSKNVSKLGLDWALDVPDATSLNSTPLAIDGVLYFSGDRAIVRAVDARTGTLLWSFDPQSWRHAPRGIATSWNTNRGIAYLDGRIFVGATDGRLIALDAKSGSVLWSSRSFPAESRKSITGAPRAAAGKVFIGHGGAEFRNRGFVDAFDAKTGNKLWRFYTVPGDPSDGFENKAMEMAAKTWSGEWWKVGGGGTVWNAITYDPELNLVYLGVGNGDPWDYDQRSQGKGDNLFLCSIVAVRADTGEYVWHYQMNPGETWDYKATADIILANINIKGARKKVLMQAPTNGFYYVIDRSNGKLLSAEKFAKVEWAERIDLTTGRPVEAPGIRPSGDRKVTMWPGPWGAHSWHAMSYNPATGLAYIPTMHMSAEFYKQPATPFRDNFFVIGLGVNHQSNPDETSGALVAWDPIAQREKWRIDYTSVWNGGTLTTAGNLVFHGTADGDFQAFDAKSGRRLWNQFVQRGISAAPISYAVDGKQHIAVLVGWGGLAAFNNAAFQKHGWKYKGPGIRLLSFSLAGKAKLPDVPETRFSLSPADAGPDPINESLALQGLVLYHRSSCAVCHGLAAVSNGASGPDLRESAAAMNFQSFRTIVADGAMLPNGMPMFSDLTEDELRAVHEYLRQQTKLAKPSQARSSR